MIGNKKAYVYNDEYAMKGGHGMARQARLYGREALETRTDYVEGKMDAAILDLKESINESRREFKESINESRKEFKESMQQMETRHQANFARLETSLDKVVAKAESSRRWSIGIVVTIALAVIGLLVSFIIFLFTNGFQVPPA